MKKRNTIGTQGTLKILPAVIAALKKSPDYRRAVKESAVTDKKLRKLWGRQFDSNVQAAQRALREVTKRKVMTKRNLDDLEDAIGTVRMMQLFASLGRKLIV